MTQDELKRISELGVLALAPWQNAGVRRLGELALKAVEELEQHDALLRAVAEEAAKAQRERCAEAWDATWCQEFERGAILNAEDPDFDAVLAAAQERVKEAQ